MYPRLKVFVSLTSILDWICKRFFPFCSACYFDDKYSFSRKKDRKGNVAGYGAPVGFTFIRVHTCRGRKKKNVYEKDGKIINLFEYKKKENDYTEKT